VQKVQIHRMIVDVVIQQVLTWTRTVTTPPSATSHNNQPSSKRQRKGYRQPKPLPSHPNDGAEAKQLVLENADKCLDSVTGTALCAMVVKHCGKHIALVMQAQSEDLDYHHTFLKKLHKFMEIKMTAFTGTILPRFDFSDPERNITVDGQGDDTCPPTLSKTCRQQIAAYACFT
jgi:hypothetical protein